MERKKFYVVGTHRYLYDNKKWDRELLAEAKELGLKIQEVK